MKLCRNCGQALAESIKTCPSCGHSVADGINSIDDYRILEVVHEGQASIVCRAQKETEDAPVALRLFTATSGVSEEVAQRLKSELEELQKLPEDWFVRHYAIRCSSDGRWYRVSEWLDAESWGDLLSSGRLKDLEVAYDLFYRLAAILDGLHKSGHFIPHLILNDILVLKGKPGRVDVKIDYKLSRFLDPKMVQPGPLLQNLLDCHPDLKNGRPLNYTTDVWSLGRIFAQILTGDLELCDPASVVKRGVFPKEIGILIRSMLADDPDLRPHSMTEVAEALRRIIEEHSSKRATTPVETAGEIKKLKKTLLFLSAIIVVLAAIGGTFMFKFNGNGEGLETVFSEYVDTYAGSVAFVVVEYQIKADGDILFQQRTEGTAFLVDADGYLLTNRHVACPWLEDKTMYRVINYIRGADKIPEFEYRMYLWFEGNTAFNRLFGIGESEGVEDVYNLVSAYSLDGTQQVKIAGVAKAPAQTRQMVRAPLRDDFAVLKINHVPPGLRPLPLDRKLDTAHLKRLSPVLSLGFPLGRTSQVDTVNVSVTRGHIRRTFENFFQVDTSIYKGNSGGPIIDSKGVVIGIVSAVATDVAVAPMPVITQLSDIGLVLPITKAAKFIDDLKAGRNKWNGILDLSVAVKIKKVTDAAFADKWLDAKTLAEQSIKDSDDPSLVMTAAMIYYCIGDLTGSSRLLDHILSIDPENYQALLMSYVIYRQLGGDDFNTNLQYLLTLNWYSHGEFFGHLARMIQGLTASDAILDSWNSPAEKGWLYYIAGLIQLEMKDLTRAKSYFQTAARSSKKDEWPLYLAISSLDKLSKNDENSLQEFSGFMRNLKDITEEREKQLEKVVPLMSEFENTAINPEKRRDLLLDMYSLEPENKKLMAYAAFYGAMASLWPEALEEAKKFLSLNGREEPLRLGIMLLVPGILNQLGREGEAVDYLQQIRNTTNASWYHQISTTLLHEQSEADLLEKAGNVPEKILTANTALGFHAEASGDRELAMKYYRQALGSYLDSWAEYEMARQRYIRLRQDDSE